jgi:hypothetical protein
MTTPGVAEFQLKGTPASGCPTNPTPPTLVIVKGAYSTKFDMGRVDQYFIEECIILDPATSRFELIDASSN